MHESLVSAHALTAAICAVGLHRRVLLLPRAATQRSAASSLEVSIRTTPIWTAVSARQRAGLNVLCSFFSVPVTTHSLHGRQHATVRDAGQAFPDGCRCCSRRNRASQHQFLRRRHGTSGWCRPPEGHCQPSCSRSRHRAAQERAKGHGRLCIRP